MSPCTRTAIARAVPTEDRRYRLIGSSYYNTASPFIRYDTGDLIDPVEQMGGIMKKFSITDGRVGEFHYRLPGKPHQPDSPYLRSASRHFRKGPVLSRSVSKSRVSLLFT